MKFPSFSSASPRSEQQWVSLRKPTLGISWVRGQFHAVYFENGECVARCEQMGEVNTLEDLRFALAEACFNLNAVPECDVAMIYEADQIQHPFMQVPPMGRKDLATFLKRRVPGENPFNEKPAWSWSHTFAAKEGEGILLHIVPKSFRDELIHILEDLGLFPKTLLPLAEVMAQHAHRLPVDKTDIVGLVATFPDQTDILMIRGDGEILFMRDLAYSWRTSTQLLVRDIDRSVLYAKQQFGIAVTHLSFAGEDSEELQESLKEHVSLPVVSPSDDDHHSFCWAMDACKLSPQKTGNLVPRKVQRRRLVRTLNKWSVMVTFLLMVCAGLVMAQVEYLVSSSDKVQQYRVQVDQLNQELDEWKGNRQRIEEKKEKLELLSKDDIGGNALLFYAYLDRVIPPAFTLKSVHTSLSNGEINFSFEGISNTVMDSSKLIEQLTAIDHNFSQPPLLATMNKSWKNMNDQLLAFGNSEVSTKPTISMKGSLR